MDQISHLHRADFLSGWSNDFISKKQTMSILPSDMYSLDHQNKMEGNQRASQTLLHQATTCTMHDIFLTNFLEESSHSKHLKLKRQGGLTSHTPFHNLFSKAPQEQCSQECQRWNMPKMQNVSEQLLVKIDNMPGTIVAQYIAGPTLVARLEHWNSVPCLMK